jgi:hypothetical protein
MPDLIQHPVQFWIPAFAGMKALTYIVAGVIASLKGFQKFSQNLELVYALRFRADRDRMRSFLKIFSEKSVEFKRYSGISDIH